MLPCHRLVLVSYNVKDLFVLFCQIVPKSCSFIANGKLNTRYKVPQSFPGSSEEMSPFYFPFIQ